jgi:PPOX class probable F420-dependent enzyme
MRGKYLSLTSHKRDGTAVATPVWFVEDGGRLLVLTGADSWKVKRIRRDPQVTVAPCSASGKPRGEPVPALAEILPESAIPRIEELMGAKYRMDRIFILPIYRLVRRLRGRPESRQGAAIAITPL